MGEIFKDRSEQQGNSKEVVESFKVKSNKRTCIPVFFIFILIIEFNTSCHKPFLISHDNRVNRIDKNECKRIFDQYFDVNNYSFETLKSRIGFTFKDSRGKIKLQAFMLVKIPDYMRFEVLNVFDQPLFICNFNSGELYLYSIEENYFEYQEKDRGDLGYIFRKFDILIPLIFGDFSSLRSYFILSCDETVDGKFYKIGFENSFGDNIILIEILMLKENCQIYQLRYKDLSDKMNPREYLINYTDFINIDSIRFPSSIQLSVIDEENPSEMRFLFKDINLNTKIDNGKFNFKVPKSARKGEIERLFDWLK
jgi:hypothetical protein